MFSLFKKCSLKTIDKPTLDVEIGNFQTNGTGDDNDVIVTLTSFPERMYELHYTLYSLLTQSVKPKHVVLWLAKEEFPNLEKDIPSKVLNFKKNGLTIKWTENIYSYKKLIPTLQEYPKNTIVTADDDIFYDKDWLKGLLEESEKYPHCIICHRGHIVKLTKEGLAPYKKWKKKAQCKAPSFFNLSTGAGGVLYPPNSLYKDVLDKNLFTKLAPKADDIYFWAMAILQNTPTMIVKEGTKELTYVNPERERGLTDETTLFSTNKQGGNDRQLSNILNHYPQILDFLKSHK